MKGVAITVLLFTLLGCMGCNQDGVEYAGCSFRYRNGDCGIWYSRKGYEVIDILITPLSEERKYLNASGGILRLPEGEVRFGTRGMAYVLDGTNWSKRPLARFHEKNIPYVSTLESCNTISEIAERVLAHPEQP